MGLEQLIFKIRKRESKIYSIMKDLYFILLKGNLPAPKIIFKPLYEILIVWRFLKIFIMGKLLYEPIFKSRCEECGKGLNLPNGIPWIEGNMKIFLGNNVMLDRSTFVSGRASEKPIIRIGDDSALGCNSSISVSKLVEIGKDCLIAANCFIADNDGHPIGPDRRLRREAVGEAEVSPVIIKDNVWIGKDSIILKGVTVGEGSIVAANSLVTRSVPPYSIVMGVPARIVVSGIDRVFNVGEKPEEN